MNRDPLFNVALEIFMSRCQTLYEEGMAARFPTLPRLSFEIEETPHYLLVLRRLTAGARWLHCVVARSGEIYRFPNEHKSFGSIFDAQRGMSQMTPFGIVERKNVD